MWRRSVALGCALVLAAPGAALAAPEPAAKNPPTPVERAQQRVKDARQDLTAAQAKAKRLTREADRATTVAADARRDLGRFAREAYRGGSTEMLGLATLIDSPTPSDTLRRATVLQLLTEHQDSQVADALAAVGQVDVLRQQAELLVSQGHRQLRAAESALKATKRNRNLLGEVARGAAGGAGTQQLTRLCLKSDTVVDICGAVPWSEQNLTFDAVIIERFVHVQWPQIKDVGGWRPSDPFPDHPSGRAVDIMMPNGGQGGDVALGDEVAEYFQKHAAEYGIYYMIWRQRIWKATDPIGQWTGMSDRGSPTANHMDHVHISVTNGASGTGWQLAELRSQDLQKLLGKDGSGAER